MVKLLIIKELMVKYFFRFIQIPSLAITNNPALF
jgi:hypothetical protein